MTADGLTKIVDRNQFYKDGVHHLIIGIIISCLLNILAIFSIIYIYTHPPAPVYFPTSSNGRITPLFPLEQPNVNDSNILEWANLATIAAFSYNFVNYRSELEFSSEYFTANGWTSFLKSLKASNNLLAVISKKLVVSAEATRTPEMLQKGIFNGRYSWRIKIPILVTYQSGQEYTQQNLEVILLITRVSTLNNPKGIGIEQFVSTTYNTVGEVQ
ncbi:MAG TPA: type IV secretion protein DotI [Legionellales bacterium]|nr:type IV secretion protein DotI [Legionellales bacterium]